MGGSTGIRRLVSGLWVVLVAALSGVLAGRTDAQPACDQWELFDNGVHGRGSGLTGVTAVSPDDVWALGGSFLLRWDGAAWASSTLPEIGPGDLGWDLRSIGSLGTGQVWSAGIIDSGEGYPYYSNVLILRWNGTEWDQVDIVQLRPQTVWPYNPRSGSPADLDAVSEDDVWVVGIATGYGDGGSSPCLALHWDGSEWTEVDVPSAGGDQEFEGVAAIASDDVWAVGYGDGGPGGRKALTYHWDGAQWNHVRNPAENESWTFLYDVTAIASDDVWAAGLIGSQPLFMHWDGSSWTIVDSPGSDGIYGLDANATDDVWAVGWPDGYYYHWDGVAWSQVDSPEVPGGSSINRTGGVAAAGPCDVWGVGGYFIGNENHALTERLAVGGVVSVPSPGSSGLFLDVSPNPVFQHADIRFGLGGELIERASVYDVRGQRVRSLAGSFNDRDRGLLTWDVRDSAGRPVPGGSYYLRVESRGGAVLTRTITVVR